MENASDVCVSSKEYTELTAQRDKLIKLLKGPTLNRHRVVLEKQLSDVREQLSNAHREAYNGKRTTNSFDIAE